MHLSETLMRDLLNSIRSIPSKIPSRRPNERGINPAYRDVEHASLCLREKRIWALRADDDLILALGIKNGSVDKGNISLLERLDTIRRSDIDIDDPYGHASLAIPEKGYDGSVYYAGWLIQSKNQIQLLLYARRYHNDALLPLQKKLLEQYISVKLMDRLGEQEVIFIEYANPDDLQYFLSENISWFKEREKRIYRYECLERDIEETILEYSSSMLRRCEQFFGGAALSKKIQNALEDETSWLFCLSPYQRQYTLWNEARSSLEFTNDLLKKKFHLSDHQRLTQNEFDNLIYGVSMNQPLMQTYFIAAATSQKIKIYPEVITQVESKSYLCRSILNQLAKHQWLSLEILFLILQYDNNKMFSLRTAIDSLIDAFRDQPSRVGQLCVEALLKQYPQDLASDQEDVVIVAKVIKKLLKFLGTGELGCLHLKQIAYHPDIRVLRDLDLSRLEVQDFQQDDDASEDVKLSRLNHLISREKSHLQLNGVVSSDIRDKILHDKLLLDFAFNGCGAEGIIMLCDLLSQNRVIKELTLRYPLQSKDIQAIATLIASSRVIEKLDLSYCHLDDEKTKLLMEGLSENHRLTVLDLSGNPILDAGAIAVAKMLPKASCLRFLKLSNCKIGDEGISALASAFPASRYTPTFHSQKTIALKTLWIDSNCFDSRAISIFAERALTLEVRYSDEKSNLLSSLKA